MAAVQVKPGGRMQRKEAGFMTFRCTVVRKDYRYLVIKIFIHVKNK